MSVATVFRTIAEHLESKGNVQTIYGEPVRAEGRTVIPVARVLYGFGAGSGSGVFPGKQSEPGYEGGGGGGGGGAPQLGAGEISESGTRFVGLHEHRRALWIAAGAFVAGMAFGWVRRRS